MSIVGYLGKRIGQDSVEDTVPQDLFGVAIFRRRRRRKGNGEEPYYASVGQYDPVLAWHCGLVEPVEKKRLATDEHR